MTITAVNWEGVACLEEGYDLWLHTFGEPGGSQFFATDLSAVYTVGSTVPHRQYNQPMFGIKDDHNDFSCYICDETGASSSAIDTLRRIFERAPEAPAAYQAAPMLDDIRERPSMIQRLARLGLASGGAVRSFGDAVREADSVLARLSEGSYHLEYEAVPLTSSPDVFQYTTDGTITVNGEAYADLMATLQDRDNDS